MAENSKIDWKRIWERTIGMRLALWLDKRHPDWCWASLCVNLGMGYDLLRWRKRAKDVGVCRQECLGPIEGCYCGKFMSDNLRQQFEKDQRDPKATELL
jgi:hypothetical protein